MTLPPSNGPHDPAGRRFPGGLMGKGFPGGLLGRVLATIAGLVMALSAAILMIGALAVVLTVAAAAVIWALLRGRRPTIVRFGGGASPFRRPRSGHAPAEGEVIEGVVREVPREGPPERPH